MEPHHQMELAFGASLHAQDVRLRAEHANLRTRKAELEQLQTDLYQQQLRAQQANVVARAPDAYEVVFNDTKLGFVVQHFDEVKNFSFRMHFCAKLIPNGEAERQQVMAGSELLRINQKVLQGVSDEECVRLLRREKRPIHVLFARPQTTQEYPGAEPRPLTLATSRTLPTRSWLT